MRVLPPISVVPLGDSSPFSKTKGMTLVELLVVIVIMGLLIGAGTAVFKGPRHEVSVKGGVDLCAALVEQAATLAESHRADALLAINTDPANRGFARQLAIYVRTETGQWALKSGPHVLPQQIYIDEDWSEGSIPTQLDFRAATPQDGATGQTAIAYQFDRNGHFIAPAGIDEPRLIVTAGTVPESGSRTLTVHARQAEGRSGFLFRRNGYVTRYEALSQIPEPTTP